MDVWFIGPSAIAGNGVFSRKRLPANFEVFREKPLVLGPRADARCPMVCVGCHRAGQLRMCLKNCGLPVCNNCVNHPECTIFKMFPEMGVREKLTLVAPVRAVFLSSKCREKLKKLERHDRPVHDSYLTIIRQNFSEEDQEIIQICCQVLDATAFETPTDGASVRGIYPTAGMLNHSCTPNTRHNFNKLGQMIVTTTRAIDENEELTTNYCTLVWGTQARSAHLLATKRFTCNCSRCLDPLENGSQLMGLYCMKKNCGGVLLPVNVGSMWSCGRCFIQVPALRISVIQKMIGGVVSGLEVGNLKAASRILCRDSLVPACSYLAIEFKINLVFLYGNREGFKCQDLRDYDLVLKKLLCVELLMLFSLLGLGLSRQRGLVLLELVATMKELERRKTSPEINQILQKIPQYASITDTQKEAFAILRDDVELKFQLSNQTENSII